MIFRIIFQSNVIGYTAGHRNRTKSRSTNQRINLFLRKQIHQFHNHIPRLTVTNDGRTNTEFYATVLIIKVYL